MSLWYSESAVIEHHAPLVTMISFWVQRVLPVHHVLQWLSLRSDSKSIAASSYEVHFGRVETSIIHLGTGLRKTSLELVARNGKHHLLYLKAPRNDNNKADDVKQMMFTFINNQLHGLLAGQFAIQYNDFPTKNASQLWCLIPLGCPNWWNEAASCYRAPSRSGTPFFSARFFWEGMMTCWFQVAKTGKLWLQESLR